MVKNKTLSRNREISVLSFNERVLQEAEDKRNPLLERLRFLGIFSSNMDEYFKVRVASIHRRIEVGKKEMTEVLETVRKRTRKLDKRFRIAYDTLTSELAKEGIAILTENELLDAPDFVRAWAENHFRDVILPLLVPLIIDDEREFPLLTDGALYFGVQLNADTPRFAVLEIPDSLPRFVSLPNSGIMFVDDLIRYNLNEVFYIFDSTSVEAYEFKISRDAELDIDDDFTEGYIRKMRKTLLQRKGGRPTRFVYDASMSSLLLDVLMDKLHIGKGDTLLGGGRYHNMKDLMNFPARCPSLSFPEVTPAEHPYLAAEHTSVIHAVQKRDILLTYPYQPFDNYIRLLREAAIDPEVREIYVTMYRSASNSNVVNALINAVKNGKKVYACIELQARFDEEKNITIAQRLTDEGAIVFYGVPSLKVHSKLSLIVRDDVTIAALSTGNFNEVTAKLYVDSLLLTADKDLVSEVKQVFSILNTSSRLQSLNRLRFRQLLVSPFNMRKRIAKLIDKECEKGKEGYILIKVNHLTDTRIMAKLRKAADAGVQLDLIVRTTYAMAPHPNIRAVSILDRYLEHQRIFIFGKGEKRKVYMASADWMERNLDWRIEVAFPINDPVLSDQVAEIMAFQVADTFKGRLLDGEQSNTYMKRRWSRFRAQERTQRYFTKLAKKRHKKSKKKSGDKTTAPESSHHSTKNKASKKETADEKEKTDD